MNEPLFDFAGHTPQPRALDLSQGHVVLLDGNNLAARSFHAAKGRLSAYDPSRGQTVDTGSLHLFSISLSKWLKVLKPTRFVVCWDGGRSVHRESIYPDYKLARRREDTEPPHGPAFKLITEFLRLTGIEQWHQSGVEADDLIAAAHRRTREEEPEVAITIMSSDKDLLQLLDENTHQLRFSSYGTDTDIWDRERVIRDLGCTPEQVPLVMALTGDPGDGVPGAKGIGPVKAHKLLDKYGWDLDKIAPTLLDGGMVKLSYQLVNLLGEPCCTVERVPGYDPLYRHANNSVERLQLLTEFCAQYQLRTLWEGVVEGTLWW